MAITNIYAGDFDGDGADEIAVGLYIGNAGQRDMNLAVMKWADGKFEFLNVPNKGSSDTEPNSGFGFNLPTAAFNLPEDMGAQGIYAIEVVKGEGHDSLEIKQYIRSGDGTELPQDTLLSRFYFDKNGDVVVEKQELVATEW